MYISASKQDLSGQELEAILSVARENNKKMGVSGLLLHVEGHFLQYLEGEQSVVEQLYQRIEKDERHSGVMRLFAGLYDQRVFTEWSMGFHRLDKDEQAELAGAIDLCKNALRDTLPEDAPEEIAVFMESFYRSSMGLHDYV